jgi:hypothetical protein
MPAIAISSRRGWLVALFLVGLGMISSSIGASLVASATPVPKTTIVANRMEIPNGTTRRFFLRLPSMGYIYVDCIDGGLDPMRFYWKNSETYTIDAWTAIQNVPQQFQAVQPGTVLQVTEKSAWYADQRGATLDLGRGVSPNPRRVIHVELVIARAALNAPCVAQAIATIWETT